MHDSFDNYILRRNYSLYFAFGQAFTSKKEALLYSLIRLGKEGSLVEVDVRAVPNCACQFCGEMLFDWQSAVGECAGTSGADSCYFSLANGLVCEQCAYQEAALFITEEVYRGTEIMGDEALIDFL